MSFLRRPFARVDRALYDWRVRRRAASGAHERVMGFDIFVPPSVLSPLLFCTGPCLARAVTPYAKPGVRVLDVGTGSGIVALAAARAGAYVGAVDLNPVAVRATRVNAMLNGLMVDVREGDVFTPFGGETFDVITFNPPFFQRPQGGELEMALSDAPGLPILGRFVEGLQTMLAPHGVALIAGSSNGALEAMRSLYDGWDVSLARSEERGAERLVVDCLEAPT